MQNPLEYLDGLFEAFFGKDKNGKRTFYPWLLFGNGYVLNSTAKEAKIREFLKLFMPILLGGGFLVGVLVHANALLLAILGMGGWYYYKTIEFTDGLSETNEKQNFAEKAKIISTQYDTNKLTIFIIVSGIFLVFGLVMLWSGTLISKLVGLLVAAFFGAKIVFLEMILRHKYGVTNKKGSVQATAAKVVQQFSQAVSKTEKTVVKKKPAAKKPAAKSSSPAAKKVTSKAKPVKKPAPKKK